VLADRDREVARSVRAGRSGCLGGGGEARPVGAGGAAGARARGGYERAGRGARAAAAGRARRSGGFRFEELEVIRQHAGLSIARFCSLAQIPRPTWYRQRERSLGGGPAKGPWPRPARARVDAVVHAYALKYPAWGHRKIW